MRRYFLKRVPRWRITRKVEEIWNYSADSLALKSGCI